MRRNELFFAAAVFGAIFLVTWWCRMVTAAHPASCRVAVADGGPMRSYGTGVAIAEHLVATNSHVLEDWDHRTRIKMRFVGGQVLTGKTLSRWPRVDVGLIVTDQATPTTIPLRSSPPPKGETVWLGGFGRTGQAWDRRGRVLGYQDARGVTGRPWYVVTGGSREGDSGAPVVDESGYLAGLTWGTDGGTTMVVRAGAIRACLRRIGNAWKVGGT